VELPVLRFSEWMAKRYFEVRQLSGILGTFLHRNVSTTVCAYVHEFGNLEQQTKFAYYVYSLKDLEATQ
jgi:hypothetical protein